MATVADFHAEELRRG